MLLNKTQIIVILSSICLFFILWKGFDTKSKNIKELEKSRALTIETTGIENLIAAASKQVPQDQLIMLDALAEELKKIGDDSSKVNILKKISAKWYEQGQAAISGHYAEQIAEKQKDEASWAIAGTTFVICVKTATESKVKDFCTKRAISSFEKAISVNPENVENRVNLALCYIENPPADNPMAGILMLRELNTKYPKDVTILNQLGRLALKTNQIPKAVERLEQAIALDKDNKTTICLLAEAYAAAGKTEKAQIFGTKCSKK